MFFDEFSVSNYLPNFRKINSADDLLWKTIAFFTGSYIFWGFVLSWTKLGEFDLFLILSLVKLTVEEFKPLEMKEEILEFFWLFNAFAWSFGFFLFLGVLYWEFV